MSANKQQDSHRPPSDDGMAKEEFIRVGTTLYKIVEQPKLNGGYIRKRIAWNNETLRQDYGKDYIGSVPKYDGFCTVPEHLRGAIRVGDGLSATALPATYPKTAYPVVGIGRTQYRQKHVPELSESPVSEQRDIQHQRGLPQPIQFRLGWKAPYRGG